MEEITIKCRFFRQLSDPNYDFCLNYLTSIFNTADKVKDVGCFDCTKEINPISCMKGYATLSWSGYIRYQNHE